MENNSQNDNNSQKLKEEVKAIKEDAKNLLQRLSKIKGASTEIMSAEMDHLMAAMNDLKDKAVGQGKEGMESLAWCIQKNPIKSLMYGFGAGIVLAMLFKK